MFSRFFKAVCGFKKNTGGISAQIHGMISKKKHGGNFEAFFKEFVE